MTDIKGDRLYVNLGASQARKRLKHFGHGVRKVESAGRNQAVIIHTATGQHLDELEAKFSDVGHSSVVNDLSQPVENLRNLGPTSAAWLNEVGITSIAELEQRGPAVAYRIVKQQRPKASLNLLWAIAAGLADKDWRELSDKEKERLLAEIQE